MAPALWGCDAKFVLRVDHHEAGIRGTPPSLYPPLREAALCHESRGLGQPYMITICTGMRSMRIRARIRADSRAGHVQEDVRIAVAYRPILRLNTV